MGTECSGRKEFNAAAPQGIRIGERDRPHRESVPARQAPLPIDLQYRDRESPFVALSTNRHRRADAERQQAVARPSADRSIGNGTRKPCPDYLLFDASWPSRPGCDGNRVGMTSARPSPRPASARSRCIRSSAHLPSPDPADCPHPLRMTRTPTASPFTRAQPSAMQYAPAS